MKIAVTGKGGVGKTTFAATLARLYADEGQAGSGSRCRSGCEPGTGSWLSQEEELDHDRTRSAKMRKLVEERTGDM